MKNKFLMALLVIIFAILYSGCNLDPGNPDNNQNRYGVIGSPFATVEELDSITNNTDEYAYWRVSRTFALMELIRFRDDHNWRGAKLSERPIIIYGVNLMPKYYEFRIITGTNLEIGAISCNARKKEGGPVAYVLPSPGDYSEVPEPSRSSAFHIIANNYPKTVVASFIHNRGGVTRGVDIKGNDVAIENDPFDYAMIHPELYTNSNVTIEMAQGFLNGVVSTNLALWQNSESIESNLLVASTNDVGLETMMEEAQSRAYSFDGGYVINGFNGLEGNYWWDFMYLRTDLLNWNNSPYLNNNYSTVPWCGPAAVAMLLASYGYTSKIRYNNDASDGYYNLSTAMGISDFNYGVTFGWNVASGIIWGSEGAVRYGYYVTIFDLIPIFQLFGIDSWGRAVNSINNNNPFVINRLGWIDGRDGGFLGIGAGHYRLGVGYKNNSFWTSYLSIAWVNVWWFIWVPIFNWVNFFTDARYYLVLDGNGAEGSQRYTANSGSRDYLNNRNSVYCNNIFWEKKGTWDYMVLEFLFRE